MARLPLKRLLVATHVEAHTHALELLAQVAHGLDGGVAGETGEQLNEVEQFLRLEGEAHARA